MDALHNSVQLVDGDFYNENGHVVAHWNSVSTRLIEQNGKTEIVYLNAGFQAVIRRSGFMDTGTRILKVPANCSAKGTVCSSTSTEMIPRRRSGSRSRSAACMSGSRSGPCRMALTRSAGARQKSNNCVERQQLTLVSRLVEWHGFNSSEGQRWTRDRGVSNDPSHLPRPWSPANHSHRKATIGSTRAALRAGR